MSNLNEFTIESGLTSAEEGLQKMYGVVDLALMGRENLERAQHRDAASKTKAAKKIGNKIPSASELENATGEYANMTARKHEIYMLCAKMVCQPKRLTSMTDLRPLTKYSPDDQDVAMSGIVEFLKRLASTRRGLKTLIGQVSHGFLTPKQRTSMFLTKLVENAKHDARYLHEAEKRIVENYYEEQVYWTKILTVSSAKEASNAFAYKLIVRFDQTARELDVFDAENEKLNNASGADSQHDNHDETKPLSHEIKHNDLKGVEAVRLFYAMSWVIEARIANFIHLLTILVDDRKSYGPIVSGEHKGSIYDEANNPHPMRGDELFPRISPHFRNEKKLTEEFVAFMAFTQLSKGGPA